MWKCPECNNEISELNYEVETSGKDYGNAILSSNNNVNLCIIEDHDCTDSESGDWTEDVEYTCPECNTTVSPRELIWCENTETEEIEIIKQPETPEESRHRIITPTNNILKDEEAKDTSSSIICKNCRHIFVCNTDRGYYGSNNIEEIIDCPKCGESNCLKEYQELLGKGYF